MHFNTLYNIFITVYCNYLLIRWRKIVQAFSWIHRLNYDRLDTILNSPYLLYSRQEVSYCCGNQVVGYNRKSRSKSPRWEARLSWRKFQVHSWKMCWIVVLRSLLTNKEFHVHANRGKVRLIISLKSSCYRKNWKNLCLYYMFISKQKKIIFE